MNDPFNTMLTLRFDENIPSPEARASQGALDYITKMYEVIQAIKNAEKCGYIVPYSVLEAVRKLEE